MFKDIADLITIRQYIANSRENHLVDRQTLNSLNAMLVLLDKKIINSLFGKEFKDFINFEEAKKTMEDVVKYNNIKSGIIK